MNPVRLHRLRFFLLFMAGWVGLGSFAAAAWGGAAAPAVSLAGQWRFALDRDDQGAAAQWERTRLPGSIQLPGVLTAQGHGDPPSLKTRWTGDGWRYPNLFREYQGDEGFKFPFFLQPPRHYVGAAWYQRDVEIPGGWRGKRVVLHLERAHWQTTVWVDGKQADSADSLGVAHDHDLGLLAPGPHTLSIGVDNRMIVNVGPLSHSVTDHTQGNWNGLVGNIELRTTDPARFDDVRVFPSVATKAMRVELAVAGATNGTVAARARYAGPWHDAFESAPGSAVLTNGKAAVQLDLSDHGRLWDEFNPHLYLLELTLDSPQGRDRRELRFGLREVGRDGTRITINGRRTFLRGTLECCIFPLTGYPATDLESWRRIVTTAKDHGLNHIRFHSWCPPEAAFAAADELGFYYHVECSSWANQGAEIGSGRPLDDWIEAEAERMVRAYGNHPSFVMMVYGNEPAGPNHTQWLQRFVANWKAKDPRRLYSTGAGWPIMPGSDFHSSPDPRIQRWGEGLGSIINAQPPSTAFDWSAHVKKHPDAPLVAHEIGQWCVYPNFAEIAKYTGYFKPRNFEIFKAEAEKNGLLGQARDFLMASGRLQVLAYKHDIEAALRTPGLGGFQLLDLHDFPGQGTALVGVLDAFWDAKDYVTAEEYRRFCGPIVPLARMKRLVLTTADTLEADLELAHFGANDLRALTPAWRLADGRGGVLAQGTLAARDLHAGELHPLGSIRVPLAEVAAPAKLVLSAGALGQSFSNAWDLFVFPAAVSTTVPEGIWITRVLNDAARSRLEQGGKVLWMPAASTLQGDAQHGPVKLGFSPIFWNTAWTEWQAPHTLGILCQPGHPAFADFPTEFHSNWQWWEVLSGAAPFILSQHRDLQPLVQIIDDWVTSRKLGLIFEARVHQGRLLACAADLERDLDRRPAARQFRFSLLRYMASDRFAPGTVLTLEQLNHLVLPPAP